MDRVKEFLTKHAGLIIAGLAGVLVFGYLMLRHGSSQSSSTIPVSPALTGGSSGGASDGSGLLNLNSGSLSNLPGNLTPPNCGPGMHPEPTVVSGGDAQPSYLVGWKCVADTPSPVPLPTPPTLPPTPVAAPAPPPQPAPPPAPAPPPQRTVDVCNWPSWCGSLWGIAQHYTGNGARWPELFNLNRGAIGPNPDLIHPGLSLQIPSNW